MTRYLSSILGKLYADGCVVGAADMEALPVAGMLMEGEQRAGQQTCNTQNIQKNQITNI